MSGTFEEVVLAVQKVDLVVEAGKHRSYGFLFGERGEEECIFSKTFQRYIGDCRSCSDTF